MLFQRRNFLLYIILIGFVFNYCLNNKQIPQIDRKRWIYVENMELKKANPLLYIFFHDTVFSEYAIFFLFFSSPL